MKMAETENPMSNTALATTPTADENYSSCIPKNKADAARALEEFWGQPPISRPNILRTMLSSSAEAARFTGVLLLARLEHNKAASDERLDAEQCSSFGSMITLALPKESSAAVQAVMMALLRRWNRSRLFEWKEPADPETEEADEAKAMKAEAITTITRAAANMETAARLDDFDLA